MAILPTECTSLQLGALHDCSVCIIDISNNKEASIYQELIECPICLDNINSNEPMLILACCKNKVHLKCLCDWYNNRENITCFICNQVNPFGDNILQRRESESSEESSSINQQHARIRSRLIQRSTEIESQEQCITACRMMITAVVIFAVAITITLIIIL